ncbi:enoyl-ACP reductase FabI [Xanthobacter sp. TB0139]|uniref:enoyl-ACP reductase FabI n=1 Tax=Xanthobacter sp. TB0139 TaxID=3459178 RepID=UPI00403A517B
MFSLSGQKALVVGVANEHSIAWGCAKALRHQGADLAITYLNEKAEPHVRPLAEELDAEIIAPLNVQDDTAMADLFRQISEKWGRLDTLIHAVAFCPADDLHGRVVDCSRDGFGMAMDISVHSFMRMVRHAEPLMVNGGSCQTLSYYGSARVMEHYNVMGPVKAALEASVRYMAAELGAKSISVNALSPGPMKTRAASGIAEFDTMMNEVSARAPTHQLSTLRDVGAYAAFLASPSARNVTGCVHMIDGGFHIMG